MGKTSYCTFTLVCAIYLLAKSCYAQDSRGDVRLVLGSNRCEGRLEVFGFSDQYVDVCQRSFGAEEARVACRQLGCPAEMSTLVDPDDFGPRTRIIQASGYECSGTESSLNDCRQGGGICSPSDNVGLVCSSSIPTTAATTVLLFGLSLLYAVIIY